MFVRMTSFSSEASLLFLFLFLFLALKRPPCTDSEARLCPSMSRRASLSGSHCDRKGEIIHSRYLITSSLNTLKKKRAEAPFSNMMFEDLTLR